MDVKYINPFLKATNDILQQTTGETIEVKKPFVKKTPYHSEHLVVLIGVTGSMHGQVIMSFDRESGTHIASKMMGGIEMDELNEIGRSAIGELCNMIMGTTATIFSEQKMKINITPPTQLTGDNLEITHKNTAICIPVQINSTVKIEINIVAQDIA